MSKIETLSEFRDAKRKLEKNISKLLNEFALDSGCSLLRISLDPNTNIAGPLFYTAITIKAEI